MSCPFLSVGERSKLAAKGKQGRGRSHGDFYPAEYALPKMIRYIKGKSDPFGEQLKLSRSLADFRRP
jgi:hypothetical protein